MKALKIIRTIFITILVSIIWVGLLDKMELNNCGEALGFWLIAAIGLVHCLIIGLSGSETETKEVS